MEMAKNFGKIKEKMLEFEEYGVVGGMMFV